MTKREAFELKGICSMDATGWGDMHAYRYLIRLHHRKDLFSYMFWKEYHLDYKDSLLSGFINSHECIEDENDISDEIFERNYIDITASRYDKEMSAIQKSIK